MHRPASIVALWSLLCLATPGWAQSSGDASTETPPSEEAGWGDDDGFDMDDDFDIDVEDLAPPSPIRLRGFLRSDWGFWVERFDDNPWAKGRQSLDLVLTARHDFLRVLAAGHFAYDAAYLHEEESYDDPTIDAYRFQALGRELLLGFTFDTIDLTIGRQIIAWGEGDALSVLDVVNPRDMREPGLSDLDDIRLAVLATRLGVSFASQRLELIVVHEADFGLRSPPFGPFSPFSALIGGGQVGGVDVASLLAGKTFSFIDPEPRFAWDQQQPLLRWSYTGSGVDLAVYAAYVMDQQGVVSLPTDDLAELAAAEEIQIEQSHPFHGVFGTSGAWAWDAWLFKWELGARVERTFNVGDSGAFPPSFEREKATTIDTVAGITYTPVSDLMLALEFSKSTFVDEPDGLLFPVDLPAFAFRASYRTLRERLNLLAAFSSVGLDSDEFAFLVRAEASYNAFDTFVVGLGYVHYNPSNDFGLLSGLDEHDQFLVKLRWDFTIL